MQAVYTMPYGIIENHLLILIQIINIYTELKGEEMYLTMLLPLQILMQDI